MNCVNCGRDATRVVMTVHHLLPKLKGGANGETCPLCQDCHRFLNTQYTENQQRDLFPTTRLLTSDAAMTKFGIFARRQKKSVPQAESRQRRHRR